LVHTITNICIVISILPCLSLRVTQLFPPILTLSFPCNSCAEYFIGADINTFFHVALELNEIGYHIAFEQSKIEYYVEFELNKIGYHVALELDKIEYHVALEQS
jgi:hypothetical protein